MVTNSKDSEISENRKERCNGEFDNQHCKSPPKENVIFPKSNGNMTSSSPPPLSSSSSSSDPPPKFAKSKITYMITFLRIAVPLFCFFLQQYYGSIRRSSPNDLLLCTLVTKPVDTWDHVNEAYAIRKLSSERQFSDCYNGNYVHIKPLVLIFLQSLLGSSGIITLSTILMIVIFGVVIDFSVAHTLECIGKNLVSLDLKHQWEENLYRYYMDPRILPQSLHIFGIFNNSGATNDNVYGNNVEDNEGNNGDDNEKKKKKLLKHPIWELKNDYMPYLIAQIYYCSPITMVASSSSIIYGCQSFQNLWLLLLLLSIKHVTASTVTTIEKNNYHDIDTTSMTTTADTKVKSNNNNNNKTSNNSNRTTEINSHHLTEAKRINVVGISFNLALLTYIKYQSIIYVVPFSVWIIVQETQKQEQQQRQENNDNSTKTDSSTKISTISLHHPIFYYTNGGKDYANIKKLLPVLCGFYCSYIFWFTCLQILTVVVLVVGNNNNTTDNYISEILSFQETKSLYEYNNVGLSLIIKPSLSLLWYFYMELFSRFSNYFYTLLSGLPISLIIPLSIRLYKYPMELITIYYILFHILFNYISTLYDLNVGIGCLLLCSPRTLARMRIKLLYVVLPSLLVPILIYIKTCYFLWLQLGSGEATYSYFQCLAYNVLVTVLLSEYISASLQRNKALEITIKQLNKKQKKCKGNETKEHQQENEGSTEKEGNIQN